MRTAAETFIGNSLDEIERNRVILALDEVFVNIVQHGYTPDTRESIELVMREIEQGLEFTFLDRAPEFDPTATPVTIDPVEHAESGKNHGLGIHLFSMIMKAKYNKRPGGGNTLILLKSVRS